MCTRKVVGLRFSVHCVRCALTCGSSTRLLCSCCVRPVDSLLLSHSSVSLCRCASIYGARADCCYLQCGLSYRKFRYISYRYQNSTFLEKMNLDVSISKAFPPSVPWHPPKFSFSADTEPQFFHASTSYFEVVKDRCFFVFVFVGMTSYRTVSVIPGSAHRKDTTEPPAPPCAPQQCAAVATRKGAISLRSLRTVSHYVP